MKLCHDASFNGGNADSETPLLEERRIQEQRKAVYGDILTLSVESKDFIRSYRT